jgi:hypothetical protein
MSVFKKIAVGVGHVALNIAIITTAVVGAAAIVQKINENKGT